MSDRTTFEFRFADAMNRFADGAPGEVDASAVAATTAARAAAGERRWFPRPSLIPLVVGLLLALALFGAAVGGARLFQDRNRVVAPLSPSAGPSATPAPSVATAAPVASAPATEVAATAVPTQRSGVLGPCASMVQLTAIYVTDDLKPLPPGPPRITLGLDDVLVSGVENGLGTILRFDTSLGSLVPVNGGRQRAFGSLVPVTGVNKFAASPDGRALSVDEGDFGQAGCGDPIVLFNEGGRVRPFPAGAFEMVSDVAWAPDGSAMYAVRRSTIDAAGVPFGNTETGEIGRGPGSVLRWDTATTNVTDLGSPCSGCMLGQLFVSPDGQFVATETGQGSVAIFDRSGTWRTLIHGSALLGWADATHLVLNDGATGLVGLDGTTRPFREPCCHGTGFSGPLSPDGSTIAGTTLNNDFLHYSVTLLNVADGSSENVLTVPDVRGCTAFADGSTGQADCEAAHPETPGPNAMSGYARVAAWAPDGTAVLLVDQNLDSSVGAARIVRTDGTGTSGVVDIDLYSLSDSLGFPNAGPTAIWLPGTKETP